MHSASQARSTVGTIQMADFLDAMGRVGADVPALRRRTGLSDDILEDPEARIPTARILEMLDVAAAALGDPLVGLRAGREVRTRGALFYLVLSSSRLSEALRRFQRFSSLPLDTLQCPVRVKQGTVEMIVDAGDPAIDAHPQGTDYLVSTTVGILRRAIPDLEVLAVELRHDEAGEPGESARVLGCPVRFGRPENVLAFSDSLLDAVPAAANRIIAAQMEKVFELELTRLNAKSAADKVAAATRSLAVRGIRPSRTTVARELRVSERTLQRMLELESRTFTELRDGVLVELAQALLANRSLKVEAVALSLGFADVPSFSKAFTRWVGRSPSSYRQSLDREEARHS